jgi:hypothetical protein
MESGPRRALGLICTGAACLFLVATLLHGDAILVIPRCWH